MSVTLYIPLFMKYEFSSLVSACIPFSNVGLTTHGFGPVTTKTYIPKLKYFKIKSITCSSKGSKTETQLA